MSFRDYLWNGEVNSYCAFCYEGVGQEPYKTFSHIGAQAYAHSSHDLSIDVFSVLGTPADNSFPGFYLCIVNNHNSESTTRKHLFHLFRLLNDLTSPLSKAHWPALFCLLAVYRFGIPYRNDMFPIMLPWACVSKDHRFADISETGCLHVPSIFGLYCNNLLSFLKDDEHPCTETSSLTAPMYADKNSTSLDCCVKNATRSTGRSASLWLWRYCGSLLKDEYTCLGSFTVSVDHNFKADAVLSRFCYIVVSFLHHLSTDWQWFWEHWHIFESCSCHTNLLSASDIYIRTFKTIILIFKIGLSFFFIYRRSYLY